jgi:alkylation response protein AidB-like acyl-CoA dehydrogenase
MHFDLTDAQAGLMETARQFAERVVRPTVLQRDAAGTWVAQDGRGGPARRAVPGGVRRHGAVCGRHLPRSRRASARARRTAGSRWRGVPSTILCGVPIWKLGTEAQKQKYLPGMCSGELVGGFCLSEPDSGSDAAGMKTRAVKRGDGGMLNGTKMWITNGPIGDVFVVTAVTDPRPGRGPPASAPSSSSQLRRASRWGSTSTSGHAHLVTCELVFEDCEVPAENLLGMENYGFIVTRS